MLIGIRYDDGPVFQKAFRSPCNKIAFISRTTSRCWLSQSFDVTIENPCNLKTFTRTGFQSCAFSPGN